MFEEVRKNLTTHGLKQMYCADVLPAIAEDMFKVLTTSGTTNSTRQTSENRQFNVYSVFYYFSTAGKTLSLSWK